MAAGEGVEPSSSSSKPDVLPVTPSRKRLPISDCQVPIEDHRRSASCQSAIGNQKSAVTLVAVEGIEPTSLDYQSSALAVELHRERKCAAGVLVDWSASVLACLEALACRNLQAG